MKVFIVYCEYDIRRKSLTGKFVALDQSGHSMGCWGGAYLILE